MDQLLVKEQLTTSHNSASEDCCSPEKSSHHSQQEKRALTSRLNRIEGQIRGIKAMIDRDTYCDDVLNQIAAVQSALNSVGRVLLESHMKSCVIEKIQDGDAQVLDELLVTIKKLMK
ncbi:DNA-binding transcriptional regulator, FrmR family [Seinonella peptonophila]|uniref:DNA-binding transcriptional regulator, FrmR family n=1 Tax=Seinonella peptonophila TaxID=112248 RepID=A0A1M5BLH3_9BACL|nr:metal-sensitive transcriptional regulator [Seinonella peptonophila]SHF43404.1 DNA-binding transcriptional regulator, FrmR family [Seinonella peptonophila]